MPIYIFTAIHIVFVKVAFDFKPDVYLCFNVLLNFMIDFGDFLKTYLGMLSPMFTVQG